MERVQLFTNQAVPEDVHDDLRSELSKVLAVDNATVIHQRAYEVPSFIQIVLDAIHWVTPLKASAAFVLYHFHKFLKSYVERLGEHAADATTKELTDRNQKLRNLLNKDEAEPLRRVVFALADAAEQSAGNTVLRIGFPLPEDYFGILLIIQNSEPAHIAYVLALFVRQAEDIEKRIIEEIDKHGVFGGVELQIDAEGQFTASWKDDEHKKREIIIESAT